MISLECRVATFVQPSIVYWKRNSSALADVKAMLSFELPWYQSSD